MEIPILRDIVFRKVFAEENTSEPILRALLNAILNLQGDDRIQSLEINDPHLLDNFDDKNAVLDVKATDNRGVRYNIEVQLLRHIAMHQRCLHYWSRLYNENFTKGKPYTELTRTVLIAIVNHPFEEALMHNIYRIRSIFSAAEFSDLLEIHVLDLTKFKKFQLASLQTPLEKWLHFLKYSLYYQEMTKQIPAEFDSEEGMAQAIAMYQRVSASRELRSLLDRQELAEHDRATFIQDATQQGMRQGLAEGMRQIAQRALARGMAPEDVADLTGLTYDEVVSL